MTRDFRSRVRLRKKRQKSGPRTQMIATTQSRQTYYMSAESGVILILLRYFCRLVEVTGLRSASRNVRKRRALSMAIWLCVTELGAKSSRVRRQAVHKGPTFHPD